VNVASLQQPETLRNTTIQAPSGPAGHTVPGIEVGLLTGGFDRPYVFGLAMALKAQGICLEVVGGDDVDRPELHAAPQLKFLNLRGNQDAHASLREKIIRVLVYYVRLIRYASNVKPGLFHILWNNKFDFFDRTLLMLYYKLRGKKIALTAHNVNAGKRDANDTVLNRWSLRIQYRLSDHIFVHTEKMKNELSAEFDVEKQAISVIPFGINNSVPDTSLTPAEARHRFGLSRDERLILFFGNIGPYKGVEYLVAAFQQIVARNLSYRLIIAGKPRAGSEPYLAMIQESIRRGPEAKRVIQKIDYIPDEETEVYFKAADVLVLPYTHVFQSGVLFLGYSFGLPVIATSVGSLKDDIIEGKTGLLCKPCDPIDLGRAIDQYFESELFKNLQVRRQEIRDFANRRHSWDIVGKMTRNVYAELLRQRRSVPD
jgi:glycosyltransferase involved in cell wall biosynthesis